MFEKVNPSHPDKLCDRIAGALVDLAYRCKHSSIIQALLRGRLFFVCMVEKFTDPWYNNQVIS